MDAAPAGFDMALCRIERDVIKRWAKVDGCSGKPKRRLRLLSSVGIRAMRSAGKVPPLRRAFDPQQHAAALSLPSPPNPEITLSHFGRRASPRWHFLPSTARPRPASAPPSIHPNRLSFLHQTLSIRLPILSSQQRAHQVVTVAQHVVTHRKGRSALQTLHRAQKIRRRHSNCQRRRHTRLFHSALAFWLSTAVQVDIGCCHSALFIRRASSQGPTHHPTTQCARHPVPARCRQWSI